MIKFMEELTAQGVMVKEVNSSNISYHSPFMEKLSVNLKNALEKVSHFSMPLVTGSLCLVFS